MTDTGIGGPAPTRPPRLLLHGFPEADPEAMARRARDLEEAGWDGLLLADSQNLTPEVFVALTVAAGATTRLELGTAVANPVTRHPAVLASAAATLQGVSHGRALLGLGRGDSALLQIGLEPQDPAAFERDADRVRRYLQGETVDEHGYPSRIAWLAATPGPPVPVQWFVSGPRLTRAAARLADRITLVVGARPDRLAARLETVRQVCEEDGRDPEAVEVGAYVIAAVDDDLHRARDLVRGNVAIFAHFQRHDRDLTAGDDAVVGEVTRRWQEATHGVAASAQAAALTDDFIDHFAVLGDAATVTARLRELLAMGLGHLVLIGPSRDVAAEVAREQETLVLAAAREATATGHQSPGARPGVGVGEGLP